MHDLKMLVLSLYLSHKLANRHESSYNLFEQINQQCITYMSVTGLERMTIGMVAKRLNLLCHTSWTDWIYDANL